MNSLVVLLSVVVLAAAKPSQLLNAEITSYAAPVITGFPAAVSHQSQLNIKTSPAVISTAAVAPIAHTVYSAPALVAAPAAIAAPAAVSSQSRIDIKSSPAIVSTVAAAAPLTYTAPIATAAFAPTVIKSAAIAAPVVAAPTFVKTAAIAAPAAVSSQSRIDIKSSPAVYTRTFYSEPAFVAAPAAIAAPAAVSSQSRLDIKSSPAVLSTVAAAAPIAYSAPTLLKSAAIATPVIASPAFIKTAAFAAPAYLKTVAPGFFKTETIATSGCDETAPAAPSVPQDTPEVIAARAAHFEAKALAGEHLIHKRSAPLFAAPVVSTYSAAPVISTYAASPLISAYSAPLAFSTPLITKAYSVHPW